MTTPHPVITPRRGVLEIAPYVGGESRIAGANRAVKLSSNENPLGPSPRALEALAAAAATVALYPDGGHVALRRAIGEVNGMDPARIVCGAGSDEIIGLLCHAYSGPGDEVVHSAHGFAMYRIYALGAGATPVAAPERDQTVDVDALLAACTERTRLVFIANPNNPTGTMLPPEAVARLAAGLPEKAMLVLDGAYAEYVREPGFDAGRALVDARDDVVMTRTFSKIHGLASLRVGWCYAPGHVIDVLNRVRGPFNLGGPAMAAAEAAIRDVDYAEHCSVQNEVWRDWLAKALARAGVPSRPSHANFVLAEFGAEGPASAAEADAFLRKRGLIVRRMESYGLPHALRVTVGDEAACRAVADAVAAFRAERA